MLLPNDNDNLLRGTYTYSAGGNVTVTITDRWQYLAFNHYKNIHIHGIISLVQTALISSFSSAAIQFFGFSNSNRISNAASVLADWIVSEYVFTTDELGRLVYDGYVYLRNRSYGNVNQASDFAYIMVACDKYYIPREIIEYSPRLAMSIG